MELAQVLDQGFTKFMPEITTILMEALSGRTWEGKESLLQALTKCSTVCKEWVMANPKVMKEIVNVCIREMRKNNKPYKRHALDVVPSLIDELEVIDVYEDCHDYLVEMAEMEDSAMEVDDDVREKPMNLMIKANAFKAMGKLWSREVNTQGNNAMEMDREEYYMKLRDPYFIRSNEPYPKAKHSAELVAFLLKNVNGNVWNVRLAVLDALQAFVEKCHVNRRDVISPEMVGQCINALYLALDDSKVKAKNTNLFHTLSYLYSRVIHSSIRRFAKRLLKC